MDITPIYNLQTRLRAAAIAGVNLLQEDFRLKRAAEELKPLEGASPVFAKLGQQMEVLLSTECPNPAMTLLDTIALTDAVICTLGTVEVKGEIKEIEVEQISCEYIVNAPCSQIRGLMEALTTSGSGNYALVRDLHETNPEIFKDYRVKHALVQALGASYAELADMVKEWLCKEDKTLLPLLKKGFDPKGKKEMVRRLQVIEAIAGAEENDFYITQLAEAEKEVRLELINALRYEQSNVDLLIDMTKTEKGKNKQMVLKILAYMDDDKVYAVFKKMAEKKPVEVCSYLLPSTTDTASRLVPELCEQQLDEVAAIPDDTKVTDEIKEKLSTLNRCMEALVGKYGNAVCDCYRRLLVQKNVFERFGMTDAQKYVLYSSFAVKERRVDLCLEELIGSYIAQSLLIKNDDMMKAFATELYENAGQNGENNYFMSAAVVVKLLAGEDCADWFDEQIKGKNKLFQKMNKGALEDIEKILNYFMRDNDSTQKYCIYGAYDHMDYQEPRKYFHRSVELPNATNIKEWMIKHGSKTMDEILYRWIDRKDNEECQRCGEYFYKRALVTEDNRDYLTYMKNCGWNKCEGLGVKFLQRRNGTDYWWTIYSYLEDLPGDAQAVNEELREVADLVKSGKVKMKDKDTADRLLKWIDERING